MFWRLGAIYLWFWYYEVWKLPGDIPCAMNKIKTKNIVKSYRRGQQSQIAVNKWTKGDIKKGLGRPIDTKSKQDRIPLVYSCSGCSNVAQLANDIAVKMNSEGIAEMSCIAGVGGKVKSLVKKAESDRPIVIIDGCPLQCAKACMAGIGIEPDEHIVLTDYNLKKRYNTELDLSNEMDVYEQIVAIVNKHHL